MFDVSPGATLDGRYSGRGLNCCCCCCSKLLEAPSTTVTVVVLVAPSTFSFTSSTLSSLTAGDFIGKLVVPADSEVASFSSSITASAVTFGPSSSLSFCPGISLRMKFCSLTICATVTLDDVVVGVLLVVTSSSVVLTVVAVAVAVVAVAFDRAVDVTSGSTLIPLSFVLVARDRIVE